MLVNMYIVGTALVADDLTKETHQRKLVLSPNTI